MTIQGKGYMHPDGMVAASRLRLDKLLEYVPKGPSERVVSVAYSAAEAYSSSDVLSVGSSEGRGASRGRAREGYSQRSSGAAAPPMRLVQELQEAAWEADG